MDKHDDGASNRGKRAVPGSGEVKGSGAGAGSGGNPEDFDSDMAGGEGSVAKDEDSPLKKP